jgi:hypothetical protein
MILLTIPALSFGSEGKEPDPRNGGALLLQRWCSDCHGPPKPSAHKSREWPGVVAQMQNHRITQGLGKINDQDLLDLLSYLQRHAHP